MNVAQLNQQPWVPKAAGAFLLFVTLQVLGALLTFKQTEWQLISPLISSEVIQEINRPYLNAGIASALGVCLMLVLYLLRQPFFVIVLGVITTFAFLLLSP